MEVDSMSNGMAMTATGKTDSMQHQAPKWDKVTCSTKAWTSINL
jgi:hypothetical protein